MKYNKSLILGSAILLFSGCVKDVDVIRDNSDLELKTFVAYAGVDTKTSLDTDLKVLWSNGDMISIFDGANNTSFRTEDDKVTSATFAGYTNSESAEYYALYPYNSKATFADGTITTELPLVQKAVKGGFDEEVAIMVARTTDDKLSFKNVNALLKVIIPEDVTNVRAIAFTTSNCRLTGKFDIVIADNGSLTVTPDAEQDKVAHRDVYLTNGNTALEPGDYYIVVMPGSYQNLYLGIETTDGKLYTKYQKKYDGKDGRFEIAPNQVWDLGTIPAAAGSKPFNLTNLPEGPVSIDEPYVLGYEIGSTYTGKTVTVSGKNNDIITATSLDETNSLVTVTFGGNAGTASMYVQYDWVTYPVTFDVRPWLRNSPANWVTSNTATYSYTEGDTYATVTPAANSTAVQWKNESVLLSRKYAPYVCVHMSKLGSVPAAGQSSATMKLDFANFNGWSGAADKGDNKFKHIYELSDGSAIYVYNLNENKLKSDDTWSVVPEDFEAKGKITCKVDKTAGLSFYGLTTHETLTQLEAYIISKGLTYTKTK